MITHRGLEPSRNSFYLESSLEAFCDHVSRGFGIEFDPYFENGKIVVSHGHPDLNNSPSLKEILNLIQSHSRSICALHLKGKFQEIDYLNLLVKSLLEFPEIFDRLLIFDVKLNTAKYLKSKIPQILLAPSVAHPYDIERYNGFVSNTLLSVDQAIENKSLFDWVWLDEWDRKEANGGTKNLYTQKVFQTLKDVGYKISLVTPELHNSSPGLLGGESHPDAIDKDRLFERIKEILALQPDAVCTDYPEEVKKISLQL